MNEQQMICLHQITCLLTRMGKAVRNARKLTLAVQLLGDAAQASTCDSSQQQQHANTLVNPVGHEHILQTAFRFLALAVPRLQELRLQGRCSRTALDSFGASCPQLTCPHVHALDVPVTALHNLALHLPRLTSVTVWSTDISKEDESRLGVYMDVFLSLIQHCAWLTALHIEFPKHVVLPCDATSWAFLPGHLQHLRCACVEPVSDGFNRRIRQIPSLSMPHLPRGCADVKLLLLSFPQLKRFVASAAAILLQWTTQRSMITQRLAVAGFELDCWSVNVLGTCREVCVMLAWLPPFSLIKRVRLMFTGTARVTCLEHLARVFPNLETLWLGLEAGGEANLQLGQSFLSPLLACQRLTCVEVHTPLTVTARGCAQLCKCLPASARLIFAPSPGGQKAGYVAEFLKSGRGGRSH